MSFILAGCDDEEGNAVIRLSDQNWDSAHFQAEVAKIIIEEGYDYEVELVSGASIDLFRKTRHGEIDVFMEGWLPNQQVAFNEAIEMEEIELLSLVNDDSWQSLFVVPAYLIKGGENAEGDYIEPLAPGLAGISDLTRAEYRELFAVPQEPGTGRIHGCVAGSECENIGHMQLSAYGLDDDYTLVVHPTLDVLFDSLQSAYDAGEPWLGYVWGPTWIAGLLDLTRLQEPAFDKTIWDETKGCAFPDAELFIACNTDFPDKAPGVADMFRGWQIDTATLSEVLAHMYESGDDPEDAAIWFLKNRKDLWTQFVPADRADKVMDAVAKM